MNGKDPASQGVANCIQLAPGAVEREAAFAADKRLLDANKYHMV
jgi:hypothetical protein